MMTIRGRSRRVAITTFLILIFLTGLGTAQAKIVVPTSSVIEVDAATRTAIVDTFEQAEQAIKAHDLEIVMAIYSPQYNYHGLKKDDIQKIWKDLFTEYQEIASTHLFTKMTKVGSGRDAVLEVTCTGHLWARSKTSGLFVPIDSWYEEVHYLVMESGGWRLRGNVGESPRVLPFGIAPHPLF
ncbi:MAG: hypothetical protein HP494_17680 [Nitrospira sp.]|nr:hypothetical protein [Nitrospira sp.]